MNKYVAALIFFVLIFGVRPMTGLVVIALAVIGTWPGGVQDLWNRIVHRCPHCEICNATHQPEVRDDRINL